MKRLAVLGQPIAHSRSPVMHGAALAELGLAGEWSYEAIEVAPEDLAGLLGRMPAAGFIGANVTIPHKRAALELCDSASPSARAIGAANTLSFGPDGTVRADNTDAPGLIAALPHDPAGAEALVLGAGGAARAAIWALREAGAEVTVWNRTSARAAELASEFGVEALPEGEAPVPPRAGILVNATSVGLGAPAQASSQEDATFKPFGFSADLICDRLVVVDLVYGATETGLVKAAKDGHAATVDGLEILVRQGAASFEIWTGLRPPLEIMRRAARGTPHDPRSE